MKWLICTKLEKYSGPLNITRIVDLTLDWYDEIDLLLFFFFSFKS